MIALEFRKTRGPAIVARMLIERIEEDDVETVIVEGVRSIEEVKEFRKHFKVKVLAVVSSPEVRFSRLKGRSRTDDPRDIVEFNERDQRELTFGIAKVMDTADTRILNEYDVGSFRRQIRDVLEELTRVG
jgi:dephospho-CoA kinase